MTRVERIKGRIRERAAWAVVARSLLRGGAIRADAVSLYAGLLKHQAERGAGGSTYFLRRHVHMLEKGLSMSPRRPVFAEGYIGELVSTFEACDADPVSMQWAKDVLTEYFKAVDIGRSKTVDSAREQFLNAVRSCQLQPNVRSEHALVPRPRSLTGGHAIDPAGLRELCEARQSVRSFLPLPVDREIVDTAISAGIQAPSACNRLPYRFLVIEEPQHAREIASLVGGTAGYLDRLQSIIVVVGDLSAYGHPRDRHLIYTDAGLASMGLLLSFESQNVSTCCINWPSLNELSRQARSLLDLESYERVVMLIAYGYADDAGIVPASGKKDLDAIRSFITEVSEEVAY